MKGASRILGAAAFLSIAASAAFAGGDYGLAGEFLNTGVGGKPAAMGRAYTAAVDDINAIYWNPAGLAMYRSGQVMFQSAPLALGGSYNYIAYSQPMYSLGSFGLAVANVSSGKVPRVQASNPEVSIGDFQDRETAYMGAYAHRFGDLLALGGTIKSVEHVIDGRAARGYGLDLGGLYQIKEDKYKVGVMLRNFLPPTYKYATENERFPTVVRVGGAASFFEDKLLTTIDFDKTLGVSQNPKVHVGLETTFLQNLFFRVGADQTQLTGGFGLRYNTVEIDYAAGWQELGLSNTFSVKFLFGGYEVDVRAVPRVFSPVGLRNKTELRIRAANRRRIINWIISIRDAKNEVVRSFQGHSAPPKLVEWDGRDAHGQAVEPGEYVYRLSATDAKGRQESTAPRTMRILAPTPFELEAK